MIEMREDKIIFNQDMRNTIVIVFVHQAYDNYFILNYFYEYSRTYMLVYVS